MKRRSSMLREAGDYMVFGTFDAHAIIFGQRLNEEMDKKGLSPQDFEDYDICAASTINGYLNHSHAPSMTIAIKIAEFLHVSLDYLFGLGEQPEEPNPYLERRAPWLL